MYHQPFEATSDDKLCRAAPCVEAAEQQDGTAAPHWINVQFIGIS
jgi:hypothetical protein